MKNKSILIVNPNYHYSFTLRDELRLLGWKADIYVNNLFPQQLLFRNDVIYETNPSANNQIKSELIKFFRNLYFFIKIILSYKYYYVYGDAEVFTITRDPRNIFLKTLLKKNISPELTILKILKKKILFFPNGCHQELLKADFIKFDNGKLCSNCVLPPEACNDIDNQIIFNKVNKYHNFVVANTPMRSKSLPKKKQIRDRFINLDEFNPNILIPNEYKLPKSKNVRILHSFADHNRLTNDKNVKGSGYILKAVNRLRDEGFSVEYIYVNDIHISKMKYIQLQADIVVDQLIYGWWGSTSIECMALGKPVVCYINPDIEKEFFNAFPDYDSLPIINANPDTIYDELKKLIINSEYRNAMGLKSRKFSEKHFNSRDNALLFEELLLSL